MILRRTALAAAALLTLVATAAAAPAHAASSAGASCSTWAQVGRSAVYAQTCFHVYTAAGHRGVELTTEVRNLGAYNRSIDLRETMRSGGRTISNPRVWTVVVAPGHAAIDGVGVRESAHGTVTGFGDIHVGGLQLAQTAPATRY